MINKNSQLFILFLLFLPIFVWEFVCDGTAAQLRATWQPAATSSFDCCLKNKKIKKKTWSNNTLTHCCCVFLLFVVALLVDSERPSGWLVYSLSLAPIPLYCFASPSRHFESTWNLLPASSQIFFISLCLSFAGRSIIIIYNRERDWHWWKKKDIPGIDIIRLSVEQTNEQL